MNLPSMPKTRDLRLHVARRRRRPPYDGAMPFWKTGKQKLADLLEEGSQLHHAGDLQGALAAFTSLVDKARAASDRTMEAAGLQRCGVVRDMLGDSHTAERNVRQALAINKELQGPDGPTVRQDLFTLAIILSGRGDAIAAEPLFLESARISAWNDPEAHARAIHNVVVARIQRNDLAGAGALLWEMRPGGGGPHYLVGMLDAPILIDLLAQQGRLDELAPIAAGATFAVGYWFAKMKMGRISEGAMEQLMQSAIDVEVACARAFAGAGRRAEASECLDRLETGLGKSMADDVRALRMQLLGGN